jgi:subtilisin family serine protease
MMKVRVLSLGFFCVLAVLLLQQSLVAAPGQMPGAEPRSWIVCFSTDEPLPATGSREEVIRFLQQRLAKNMVRFPAAIRATPLWIANAVAIRATAAEVAELAALPNVDRIVPDRTRQWIRPGIDWRPVPAPKVRGPVWSVEKVRAPEVWSKLKIDGSGVVVGIIDTGIYEAHPALKGKVLKFKDFSPAAQVEPYDDQGHGTHCAGTIVGGAGVGVAPGARLIVAKVFDKTGNAEDSWVLAAMQWVMDPDGNPQTNDGPRLISNSWGSNDITDKTFWDSSKAWVAAGIVPVFAAGNNGPSGKVAVPANHPHNWAVGATTKADVLAFFSSIGPVSWDGVSLVKPDISAPGAQVLSCGKNGNLVYNSGTSMACPHVAGLAALMLQARPKLTIAQVRALAEETALDLGAAGKDNKFGAGRIDAFACLEKVLATATLADSFAAYEEALQAERALIGIEAVSPLTAPLASSLLVRALDLDAGEFRALSAQVSSTGAAARVLQDAARLRLAAELHQ